MMIIQRSFVCSNRIPRGGSIPKLFNTSNLRKHLEHWHRDKYRKLLEVEKEKAHVKKSDEKQVDR